MKYVEGYTSGENPPAMNDISTSDLIHYCGNWVWRAVDALVQSKDFNPNPTWIADRLNISVESAKDALDGLIRIGVIIKTDSGFVGNDIFKNIDGDIIDRSDRFGIHNKIKEQIANRMSSRECFSNMILLSSKNDINEFYHKFCALVEELNSKNVQGTTNSEVFGMELSLTRLTRDQK